MARMTRGQVPILDLRIKCGSTVQDISLWLYVGDMVELTHLKATIAPDGKGKFASSNHTTGQGTQYMLHNTHPHNIQIGLLILDWLTFNGQ